MNPPKDSPKPVFFHLGIMVLRTCSEIVFRRGYNIFADRTLDKA